MTASAAIEVGCRSASRPIGAAGGTGGAERRRLEPLQRNSAMRPSLFVPNFARPQGPALAGLVVVCGCVRWCAVVLLYLSAVQQQPSPAAGLQGFEGNPDPYRRPAQLTEDRKGCPRGSRADGNGTIPINVGGELIIQVSLQIS
jgi:hypothetical protein